MSKCPKCEATMKNVNVEEIKAHTKSGKEFNAISFSCPDCSITLGIQIDPLATDIQLLNNIRSILQSQ